MMTLCSGKFYVCSYINIYILLKDIYVITFHSDICNGGAFEYFFTNAYIKNGICQKKLCLKQDAQHVCQENNATLIRLDSPEKNMAVQTYLRSKGQHSHILKFHILF